MIYFTLYIFTIISILNLTTNYYKSYNNERYQQKSYKSYNNKNVTTIKLQYYNKKTTNLATIKLSKIKPSTAQFCYLMKQYHQVPTRTALY